MHRSARLHIAHIVHGATHKNRADVFHFCFVYSTRSQWAHSTTLKNAMCLIFHSIDRARLCMFYLILFVISNFCFVAKDEDQAHNVTQKTQLEDEEKKNKSQNAFFSCCAHGVECEHRSANFARLVINCEPQRVWSTHSARLEHARARENSPVANRSTAWSQRKYIYEYIATTDSTALCVSQSGRSLTSRLLVRSSLKQNKYNVCL